LLDYAGSSWIAHHDSIDDKESLSDVVSEFFLLPANVGLSFQVYWFRTLVDGYPQKTTPLHIASYYGLFHVVDALFNSPQTFQALNTLDGLGRTPLHWACLRGYTEVIQRLVDEGAEVGILDHKGFNPMGLAALNNQTMALKQLLDKQSNVAQKINTPDQLAIALLAAAQGKSNDSASLLLEAGADPNLPVHKEMDPLWIAAWEGNLKMVELLLTAGADVDNGRRYGNALQEAAANGSVEVVELLLSKGANPNSRGGAANTAINAAAFRGHKEVVRRLLHANAVVELPDDPLGGAKTLAEAMGHTETLQLI
ncbi:ankyrin repeat-containing domain protein, partial [Geopyxis carbonaria]